MFRAEFETENAGDPILNLSLIGISQRHAEGVDIVNV